MITEEQAHKLLDLEEEKIRLLREVYYQKKYGDEISVEFAEKDYKTARTAFQNYVLELMGI